MNEAFTESIFSVYAPLISVHICFLSFSPPSQIISWVSWCNNYLNHIMNSTITRQCLYMFPIKLDRSKRYDNYLLLGYIYSQSVVYRAALFYRGGIDHLYLFIHTTERSHSFHLKSFLFSSYELWTPITRNIASMRSRKKTRSNYVCSRTKSWR